MSRIKLYGLNIFLLLMTVPWFFINTEMESIGGFPHWALYVLFSTFIYAISIFYFLHRYWSISASEKSLKK